MKSFRKNAQMIFQNPYASLDEIAMLIGNISRDGVKYQINKLKRANIIRRIGPDKGGYWEIIKR